MTPEQKAAIEQAKAVESIGMLSISEAFMAGNDFAATKYTEQIERKDLDIKTLYDEWKTYRRVNENLCIKNEKLQKQCSELADKAWKYDQLCK